MHQNFNANQRVQEVLILKNGKQNHYSTFVERFLEKQVNFQEMQIHQESLQQIKQNCLNKALVILLCQVSDRMELDEADIISQLDNFLEKRLVIIYVSPVKPPNPYFVAKKATEINVNLQNKDEELVENTLKECLNLKSASEARKDMLILVFISTLLLAFVIYQYFQCDSIRTQIKSLESQKMTLQNAMTEISHNYTILQQKYQDLENRNQTLGENDGELENERVSPIESQWAFLIFFALILIVKILEKWLLPGIKMLFKKSKSSNEQEEIEISKMRGLTNNSIQIEMDEEEAKKSMKNNSGANLVEGRSLNENFSTKSSVQEVEPEEAEKPIEDNSMSSSVSIEKLGDLNEISEN